MWTPEEDELILELVAGFGNQVSWKAIENRFTGRTRSSIRNRYHRIRKGEKIRNGEGVGRIAKAKNRCHACGELKIGHVCKAKKVSTADATKEATGATGATGATEAVCDEYDEYDGIPLLSGISDLIESPPKRVTSLSTYLATR